MVVIVRRDGVHADARLSQPGGDRRQESHGVERRVHVQGDARPQGIGCQTTGYGLIFRSNHRNAFLFSERAYRIER